MPRHHIRPTQWVLILLCIAALLLRLPSCFTPFWSLDEAVSACVANAILDGGIPYQDAIDHRGPVTYYAYSIIFFIFGQNNMIAVHFGLFLLVACVGFLLYLCGVMIAERIAGLLAAAFFFLLAFGLFGAKDVLAAHTEYMIILFSTLAVYCFLRHLLYPDRKWLLFVSGMCYGLAFFAKQPALVDAFAVVCFLCAQMIFRKTTWQITMQRLSLLIAGSLSVSIVIIGFFFFRGGLQDFVFYFWTYNTKFYITNAGFADRFNIMFDFFRYTFKYFTLFVICFLSGGIYVVSRFLRSDRQQSFHKHDPQLLFVIWSIGALTVPVLSGRIPSFGHYYIQLFPAFSIVCGIAAHGIFEGIKSWLQQQEYRQNRMLHQWLLPGSALLLGLLVILAPMLSIFAERFVASFPGSGSNAIERTVVQYIREQTTSDDSIFVWGFYPELYVLTDRRPASRYTFTNVLTGFIPWMHMEMEYDTSAAIVPGTWDILMDELLANQPALIIDTSPGQFRGYGKYPPQKFPVLSDFLKQYYEASHDVISETNLVALRIFKRRNL